MACCPTRAYLCFLYFSVTSDRQRWTTHSSSPLQSTPCYTRATGHLYPGSKRGGRPIRDLNEASPEGRYIPNVRNPVTWLEQEGAGRSPGPTRPACLGKLPDLRCGAPGCCLLQAYVPHLYLLRHLQARQEGWDREVLHTVGHYSRFCGESERMRIYSFLLYKDIPNLFTEFLQTFFPQET